MPRKNIYLDTETLDRLTRLTADYASDSEAIRVAVARLYALHYGGASEAGDAVLDRIQQALANAQRELDRERQRRLAAHGADAL